MNKISCTKTFQKSKWMLTKSGLWPSVKLTKSRLMKLLFTLLLSMLMFVIVIHNIVHAFITNNIKLLNWMICVLIPLINYTAKSCTLLVNRDCFRSLLKDLESTTFNEHNEHLNKHIQIIYRISNIFLRYFAVALTLYMIVGSFLPIVINTSLIIPTSFDTGKFDILYKMGHFLITGYTAFNSIGFDVLYMTLMSLCIAQLNILEERLNTVFEDARKTLRYEENFNLRVEIILGECIVLHETINKFVKKLSILLSFPLFVQYVCGCFTICNAVLQLTIMKESGSSNLLSMFAYTGVTFGQMAAYHWLGNEIIFKSDKIIESSYVSKWYALDTKYQRAILLLMERSKRSLIVQLYKFIYISLDSLGVIVRWAYSVFALINARYK